MNNHTIVCTNCKNKNILDDEEYYDFKNGLLHCNYCIEFLKADLLTELIEQGKDTYELNKEICEEFKFADYNPPRREFLKK